VYLRKLLVQGAHVILGRNGSDSACGVRQRLISRAVRERRESARGGGAETGVCCTTCGEPARLRSRDRKPAQRCQAAPEAAAGSGRMENERTVGISKLGWTGKDIRKEDVRIRRVRVTAASGWTKTYRQR